MMRLLMVAAVAGATSTAKAATDDASFGCQVLLCAASSNPSWSGISYCVPVMHRLFDLLATGHPWPACSEGKASSPVYQPLADCPEGLLPATKRAFDSGSPSSVGQTRVEYLQDVNGTECAPLNQLNTLYWRGPDLALKRERRSKPYFVDITTADGTERYWFTLNDK